MIHIIGAGGVGSWLTPSLCLLVGPRNITVVDGDRLEKKNLNRQLFSEGSIGGLKAEALASKYGCASRPQWFSRNAFHVDGGDWLIGCADNDPTRIDILEVCDSAGCRAIIGATETHSAEAYYYEPSWKGTADDPRVYYPEMTTNHRDDPRAAAIGCTGEAQTANPQLVSANFMAAALVQHLFVLWAQQADKLDIDSLIHLPCRLRANLSKLETIKQERKTNANSNI